MKKMIFATGLATIILASACSNETPFNGTNSDGTHVVSTESTTRVLFNVGLPAGDPLTYAEIQTPAEKTVSRLDVYQFADGEQGTLEAVYYNVTKTPVAAGYQVSLDVKGEGNKQFVFVANNSADNNGEAPTAYQLHNGTSTVADLMKIVTKPIADKSLNGAPLLMTARVQKVAIQDGAVDPAKKVILERVMSRVDIQNNEPLLTITRIRLENTVDRGYLMPQAVGVSQVPTEHQMYATEVTDLPQSPISGAEKIEMENIPGSSTTLAGTLYKHVFYPYPCDVAADEATAPTVVVEGILFKDSPEEQTKVVYRIPLKIKGETNFLAFKRNTRYTLVINKAIPGQMESTIVVDQWNTENIKKPLNIQAPEITEIWGNDDAFSDGLLVYSVAENTLTVASDFNREILFVVNRNFLDWEVLLDGSTQVPSNHKVTEWLIATSRSTVWRNEAIDIKIPALLSLQCSVNTTGQPRTARLVMRAKADHNLQTILIVTQK